MKPMLNAWPLFILACTGLQAQPGAYAYKRELTGISDQWHRIELPDAIFGKTRAGLADLRIFGITENNDTLEAPYLLRVATEKSTVRSVPFNTINSTRNAQGYFYTFELEKEQPVNQIELAFEQQNFDWRVRLEGSNDQREWFTILDNYRILAIRNTHTDFQFTKLAFPAARYRYFRLRIPAGVPPGLLTASLSELTFTDGVFRTYAPTRIAISESKKARLTEIELTLPLPVPVSQIGLLVRDKFDYYRPISIACLTDSVKTETGWAYNYTTLETGTLNSLEAGVFHVPGTICQRLKIVIQNQDNQPLQLDSVTVKGYAHELVARFTEPARYYLVYGKADASAPRYDIGRFTDKIPGQLQPLGLGNEQVLIAGEPASQPFFLSKAWLWGVLLVVGVLLGWFTVVLMRK